MTVDVAKELQFLLDYGSHFDLAIARTRVKYGVVIPSLNGVYIVIMGVRCGSKIFNSTFS